MEHTIFFLKVIICAGIYFLIGYISDYRIYQLKSRKKLFWIFAHGFSLLGGIVVILVSIFNQYLVGNNFFLLSVDGWILMILEITLTIYLIYKGINLFLSMIKQALEIKTN